MSVCIHTKLWWRYVHTYSQVQVIQESFAYTEEDLLADFGGYTGIFVGASLMTLYDLIFFAFSKARTFISNMSMKWENDKVQSMKISSKD